MGKLGSAGRDAEAWRGDDVGSVACRSGRAREETGVALGPKYLLLLPTALPLDARTVKRLCARTGAADDLEVRSPGREMRRRRRRGDGQRKGCEGAARWLTDGGGGGGSEGGSRA